MHKRKRNMFSSSYFLCKNISLVNTISKQGGKIQKKKCSKIWEGKKNAQNSFSEAADSRQNASFFHGHFG